MKKTNPILFVCLFGCFALAQAQEPDQQSTASVGPYRPPDHIVVGPDFKGGNPHHAEMLGKTISNLTFSAPDGSEISLDSYRGKPLLIDLWATWCAPCLAALPRLNQIYQETRDRGLILVSFDQDRQPQTGTRYLVRHHYAWSNYHDGERRVENALQGDGIPLTVLMDAKGKIVYFDFSNDEVALRKAIASLGPEFASVDSSRSEHDCGTNDDNKPQSCDDRAPQP